MHLLSKARALAPRFKSRAGVAAETTGCDSIYNLLKPLRGTTRPQTATNYNHTAVLFSSPLRRHGGLIQVLKVGVRQCGLGADPLAGLVPAEAAVRCHTREGERVGCGGRMRGMRKSGYDVRGWSYWSILARRSRPSASREGQHLQGKNKTALQL